jgi:hypothetical protein
MCNARQRFCAKTLSLEVLRDRRFPVLPVGG